MADSIYEILDKNEDAKPFGRFEKFPMILRGNFISMVRLI